MGSSGSKPRKRKSAKNAQQHLPKVGTATENQRLLHEEQHAVAAQMGLGSASAGTRKIVLAIVAAIVIIAVLSLLVLITFR